MANFIVSSDSHTKSVRRFLTAATLYSFSRSKVILLLHLSKRSVRTLTIPEERPPIVGAGDATIFLESVPQPGPQGVLSEKKIDERLRASRKNFPSERRLKVQAWSLSDFSY